MIVFNPATLSEEYDRTQKQVLQNHAFHALQ